MGEPQVAADPVNVRVDGNDELGWRNRPQAEIDAIGRPDHPTRVQSEPLARASGSRIADEMSHVAALRVASKRVGEACHALPEIPAAFGMKPRESTSERVVLSHHGGGSPKQECDVLAAVNAMNEVVKETLELSQARLLDARRRTRTQARERPSDASPRRDCIPECQARCNQPDDFLISGVFVTMNEIDWITTPGEIDVATGEEHVETMSDTVHFTRVLAILMGQPQ